MSNIITVKKLEKSFKDKKVINSISFEVKEGEILCFLGPNGAGKSTTINILTGALAADNGEIYFQGKKINTSNRRYKELLGIVPQDISLYEDISAEQNIKFFASLYGLKGRELKEGVEWALEFSGLKDRRNDKVKNFSGGMKRRLNIACAITHKPKLLIMDEPTVGIDPQSRNHILESVKEMAKAGMTIIYTTHYMEEVEEISTRIIIMDKGNIIATGDKEALKETVVNYKKYLIQGNDIDKVDLDRLFKIEGINDIKVKEGDMEITSISGIENIDKVISALILEKVKIKNLTCEMPNLETVFLNLTGNSLRD